MPSSAKDRFTVDFEKIFMFVKQGKYWFEQQLEPHKECSINARGAKLNQTTHEGAGMSAVNVQLGEETRGDRFIPERGRNKRCVWKDESVDIDELLLFISQHVDELAPGVWEQIGKEYGLKKSVWDVTTKPFKTCPCLIRIKRFIKCTKEFFGDIFINFPWTEILKILIYEFS